MFSALYIDWVFDPVAFTIPGLGLEVRYYGLMWALAIFASAKFYDYYCKREALLPQLSETIFIYGVMGIIIGSRLGHCLFYEPAYYLKNPMEIILGIRNGGMASHGAAMGLFVGLWLYSRQVKLPLIWSLDRVVMPLTLSATVVRLGNLFNSEIFGFATERAWGFRFLRSRQWVQELAPMACHPTQLYEAFGYFISFVALCIIYKRTRIIETMPGVLAGIGFMMLGIVRFVVEFWKLNQVEFENNMTLTMGQWLSIPFILMGIVFIVLGHQGRFAKVDVKAVNKLVKEQKNKKNIKF